MTMMFHSNLTFAPSWQKLKPISKEELFMYKYKVEIVLDEEKIKKDDKYFYLYI